MLGEWQTLIFYALGPPLVFLFIRELLFICYIAARSEFGALRMAVVFYKLGVGVISDILGEEVKDKKFAIRASARYILHLRHLHKLRSRYPGIRLAISVKLSQLGLKFDKDLTRRLLRKIYKECLNYGIELEVDVEGPEIIEDTLYCILQLARLGGEFRQAVAANQIQSESFLLTLAKLGVKIRLVKGAYRGSYQGDAVKFNYWRLAHIAKLYRLDTAYGSHDLELIGEVRNIWQGVVQMLFGVRMFARKDWVYMPWGKRRDAGRFLGRRLKEGIRPSLFFTFIRNIPESLIWRLRYAPLSFFGKPRRAPRGDSTG